MCGLSGFFAWDTQLAIGGNRWQSVVVDESFGELI